MCENFKILHKSRQGEQTPAAINSVAIDISTKLSGLKKKMRDIGVKAAHFPAKKDIKSH